MDPAEVRAMEDHMAELTNVRYADIIDHVIANNLLNLGTTEELTAKATNKEKMRQLYLFISRCPRRGAFKQLLDVLRETNYEWLAEKLEDKRKHVAQRSPRQDRDSGIELDLQLGEDRPDGFEFSRCNHFPDSPSDSPLFYTDSDEIVYIQHQDSGRVGLTVEPTLVHGGREGFVVKEMRPHGLGQRTGDIRPGDVIHTVNGRPCDGMSVHTFLSCLRPEDTVYMEVILGRLRKQVCWLERRTLDLHRKANTDTFGLLMVMGIDRPRRPGDTQVYVSGVVPGSAADRAGLKARDTILAVRGTHLASHSTPDTVKEMLQAVDTHVNITIERRNFLGKNEVLA